MRLTAPCLALAAFAIVLPAAAGDLDPKILSLIGPETKAVFGADLGQFRSSPFYGFIEPGGKPGADQVIQLFSLDVNHEAPLTILRGGLSAPREAANGSIALDQNTTVNGDPEAVRLALERWAHNGSGHAALAERTRTVSASYDAWFLVIEPLALTDSTQPAVPLKFRDQLIRSIEELSGGIRFGKFDEFRVEAVMRTSDDAGALAALARWFPGFVQMMNVDRPEGALLNSIDDLDVRVRGTTVSMSFSIEDAKFAGLPGRFDY